MIGRARNLLSQPNRSPSLLLQDLFYQFSDMYIFNCIHKKRMKSIIVLSLSFPRRNYTVFITYYSYEEECGN